MHPKELLFFFNLLNFFGRRLAAWWFCKKSGWGGRRTNSYRIVFPHRSFVHHQQCVAQEICIYQSGAWFMYIVLLLNVANWGQSTNGKFLFGFAPQTCSRDECHLAECCLIRTSVELTTQCTVAGGESWWRRQETAPQQRTFQGLAFAPLVI
jgi:hypothetical protein